MAVYDDAQSYDDRVLYDSVEITPPDRTSGVAAQDRTVTVE